jgi:hypothetical protein
MEGESAGVTMCNHCFEAEIESFKSIDQWDAFDLALTKKVVNSHELTKLEVVSSDSFDKVVYPKKRLDNTVEKYECNYCGQIWLLSTPNFPWTGFLVTQN